MKKPQNLGVFSLRIIYFFYFLKFYNNGSSNLYNYLMERSSLYIFAAKLSFLLIIVRIRGMLLVSHSALHNWKILTFSVWPLDGYKLLEYNGWQTLQMGASINKWNFNNKLKFYALFWKLVPSLKTLIRHRIRNIFTNRAKYHGQKDWRKPAAAQHIFSVK